MLGGVVNSNNEQLCKHIAYYTLVYRIGTRRRIYTHLNRSRAMQHS